MLKKLKLLLSLRAWLKSDTLKTGGVIGIIGAAQAFLQTDNGMHLIDLIAGVIHISSGTLSGLLLGVAGVAMLFHRAMTEWGLDEKVTGKDQQSGFSTLGFLVTLFVMGVLCLMAFPSLAQAEVKTFTYVAPTQYTDGTPLPLSDFNYTLECGNVPGSASLTESWSAGPLSRQVDIPPGIWYCALKAITTASAQYPNRESMRSNEVNFTVPADPEAPTNLAVD
jgi:hypothetical protein